MGFAVERVMNAMLFNAGGVDLVAYAVVVPSCCGDDAGGLRAGAASVQDRANAGAAVRVAAELPTSRALMSATSGQIIAVAI